MSANEFKKYNIDFEVEVNLDTEGKVVDDSDEEEALKRAQMEEEERKKKEERRRKREILLTGKDLDDLGEEIGVSRNNGESDKDYRNRMAMKEVEGNLEKCLEAALAKRRKNWSSDEVRLYKVFQTATVEIRKKFITDYLNREEYSEKVQQIAARYYVRFPEPCVLSNELRELMVWFLGTVAPWERDPCLGCTHCPLGKHPGEEQGQI
ncbi:MAG: hypothetical protein XD50_0543 [Clostridia bacterium 41_269]|nr:MAG: hypothetical protein XD50_0543 [Clostridia bacterium 41_269]